MTTYNSKLNLSISFYATYLCNSKKRAYLITKINNPVKEKIEILKLKTKLNLKNGQFIFVEGLKENKYFKIFNFTPHNFPIIKNKNNKIKIA